jgi:hypothetical protein
MVKKEKKVTRLHAVLKETTQRNKRRSEVLPGENSGYESNPQATVVAW